MSKLHLTRIALAVLFVAVTSGCSSVTGELEETGFADTTRPTAQASTTALQDSKLAFAVDTDSNIAPLFQFVVSDLSSSQPIQGADLFQDAPLLMIFTVPSCAVCKIEGPKLAAAADLNPDINYVIVHSYGTTESYNDYVVEAQLFNENVIHLADTEGALWERFGVVAQPSSILVDSSGNITSSTGALGDDGLARAAEQVRKT